MILYIHYRSVDNNGLLFCFFSCQQVNCQRVDINMKDNDGATGLHFAASRGHVDVVRWLLSKGARVCLDNFGKSPLNDAAENEQLEVCTQSTSLYCYSSSRKASF